MDALGRPIRPKPTEGQAHDGRSAADMFDTVTAGRTPLAERAYASDALHEAPSARGAVADIGLMPNRATISPFSAEPYKLRNHAERVFNKIQHVRAVATRYDKRDDNDLASVQLASIRIWLRTHGSVT